VTHIIFSITCLALLAMPARMAFAEPLPAKVKVTKVANGVWRLHYETPESFTPFSLRAEEPKVEAINALSGQPSPPFGFDKVDVRIQPRGTIVEIPLGDSEDIFGLGLGKYRFGQRGLRKELKTASHDNYGLGAGHAPVPFYVSTANYGVYVDTARYATFYLGTHGRLKSEKATSRQHNPATVNEAELYRTDQMQKNTSVYVDVPVTQGIDVYIFAGGTIREVIQRYNLFSGGGCLPPLWGLGLKYEGKGDHDATATLSVARSLRRDGIPCDAYTFPVAWETHAYASSLDWNKKKFPDPPTLLKELLALGIRPSLWEQAYIDPASPLFSSLKYKSGDFAVWRGLVPDFAQESVRALLGDYHKREFIDKNIYAFKLDECDGDGGLEPYAHWQFPEHSLFPSGIDGEQMQMLLGSLYQRSMHEAFKKANRRTFGNVRASYALASPYPFVLYSDEYNYKEYVTYNVNAGFLGLLWDPELRQADSFPEYSRRLGVSAFSAIMHVDAWQFQQPPWLQPDIAKNNAGQLLSDPSPYLSVARRFVRLRMSLIPYLYSAYVRYAREGVPPVRALICDYPGDTRFRNTADQWMLGDSLLVAPLVPENAFEKLESVQTDAPRVEGPLKLSTTKSEARVEGEFPKDAIAGILLPVQLTAGEYIVTMRVASPFPKLSIRLWERVDGKNQDFQPMYLDNVPCSEQGMFFQKEISLPKSGNYTLVVSKDYATGYDAAWIAVRDLLVERVIRGENSKREYRLVNLPEGNWYDFWTRQLFAGGRAIVVKTGLGHIPVYVKENTLLPLAKPLECVPDNAAFELVCIPYGPNPQPFTLYEDDGVTYDLLSKGACNQVTVNKHGEMKRAGNYSGVRYKSAVLSDTLEPLHLPEAISLEAARARNWPNVTSEDRTPLPIEFANIAPRGSWKASSTYTELPGAGNLLDESDVLQPYAFSTALQDNPWLEINLKAPATVKRIAILNRNDGRQEITERATPMTVSTSINGKDWQTVWDTTEPAKEWTITFKPPVQTQFVRIETQKNTYLHLSKVQIFGR
jgi:alpha-D-xyloside xylohydrolase